MPQNQQHRQQEGGGEQKLGEHQRKDQVTGTPGRDAAGREHNRDPKAGTDERPGQQGKQQQGQHSAPATDEPRAGKRQSDEDPNESATDHNETFEDDSEIRRLKDKSKGTQNKPGQTQAAQQPQARQAGKRQEDEDTADLGNASKQQKPDLGQNERNRKSA